MLARRCPPRTRPPRSRPCPRGTSRRICGPSPGSTLGQGWMMGLLRSFPPRLVSPMPTWCPPSMRAERQASGDPRPAITERYASKEDYLRRVKHTAETLVQQGYLLAEDLPTVTDQAAQRYDLFRTG